VTGFTLFAGGGGVELGLPFVEWVGGVEYDAAIAAHHTKALGTPITVADVRDVDYRQWRGVDSLHLSPPCTRASKANTKGKANGGTGETELDTQLADACCRAIAQISPRFVTLENVPDYAKFEAFRTLLCSLKCQGYKVAWSVYDAADFGVPQHRDRLLLRAWRDSKPLPDVIRTHASPKAADVDALQPKLFGSDAPLRPWNGWYGAVADLLDSCPEKALAPWQVKRLEAQYGKDWLEKLVGGLCPVLIRYAGESSDMEVMVCEGSHTMTSDGASKTRAVMVGSGGYGGEVEQMNGNLPSGTQTSPHSATQRALLIEGQSKGQRPPSVTEQGSPSPAQCGTGGGNLNRAMLPTYAGYRTVALTTRCIARLMSVPDSYPLPESKSLATTILGNSVPPGMASAVFGSMLKEVTL
jgi:DNA (cytosine-5)-methyltransferase 1